MGSTIAIVTFEEMNKAGEVLDSIHKLEDEHLVDLSDAAVIVKDENGEIKTNETKKFSRGAGAATGGALGFMLGAALGGPVGGILVGAAAGAWASKKVDLGISDEKIDSISKSLPNSSSVLFLQIKSVTREGLLKALIRESGGTVIEVDLSDADEANIVEEQSNYLDSFKMV